MALLLPFEVFAKVDARDFIKEIKSYKAVCKELGLLDENHQQRKKKGIIAFHVRIEKFKQNLAFKAVVIFGKVTLNSGQAYDGSTEKFTAPVDGIYSFTWTIATTHGRRFSTAIVRNDEIIGYNLVNGKVGSINSESGSATAIIKMAKNDKVWIRVQEHGEYAYALWSSFSGFLL